MAASLSIPEPAPSAGSQRLRPAERVRQYLASLSTQIASHGEHRLPGAQHLAHQLSVSPRTVATVYKEMAEQGVVRTRVGDGTYLVGRSDSPSREFRVGLNVPLPSDGSIIHRWGSEICGGILEMAGEMPAPVAVVPLPRSERPEEFAERTLAMLPRVDGLILFPNPAGLGVREAYEAAGKPAVSLSPPTLTATTDFVSCDYYHASMKLGVALRLAGRRRILFLISGLLERSVSTRLDLAGLIAGVGGDLGGPVTVQVTQAEGAGEEYGREAVERFLAANEPPDAIYATGDMLALGAIQALEARGLRIPVDASVVGGTGYQLETTSSHLRLTSCRQPLHDLGRRLLEMLVSRLQHPGMPAPGLYLGMPFIGGGTTRESENLHLEIPSPQ